MSKTKRSRRPYWQTSPCPPWCHGKHSDDEGGPDRRCSSRSEGRLVLTIEDPVLQRAERPIEAIPRTLITYVVRDYREVEPHIEIEDEFHPEGDRGRVAVSLTLAEAAKLAAQLTNAVELAGGVR